VFRHFRGADDYPVIAGLINASNAADGIDDRSSVEEITHNYEHLENCNLQTDMLFVEVEGTPIGYSRVEWWQEAHGPRIYWHLAYLHPAWQRRGIGRAVLCWNEARLRAIAVGQTTDTPRVFQVWSDDARAGVPQLLAAEGYSPVRYSFEMARPHLDDIPDFSLPSGLEVRPVMPEQIRAIWEAHDTAFRDHWGYAPPTEADYQRFLNFPHIDPALWRIVWDGDRVAGQVKSYIDQAENVALSRKRGYTEDISVGREWRRQGVARALLAQSLHALKERGMTEAALGVDAENPTGALQVYKTCGFRVTRRSTTYRKPMEMGDGG
jgi:ribosomal protein S18 acetylase RimI-like enzyme